MAAALPEPAGPAYSIAALARIPIRDGMKASEIAHLTASQAHTAETLAMTIDAQRAVLRKIMSNPPTGSTWSKITARSNAARATRPMAQAAERIRGGAAASRASWRVIMRVYAEAMMPAKGKRKGVSWTA